MIDVLAEVPERLRRLTRTEYRALAETGAFDGERVELLGGFVVAMSPQNRRHALAIQRLTKWLVQHQRPEHAVRPQLPLELGETAEPEPDLAVTDESFDGEHPSTAHLVVEVADSSVRVDRLKARLYAEAGIPECWLVNLEADVVEVMRDPGPDGYRHTELVGRGGSLEPLCMPGHRLLADDVIPDRR